MSEGSRALKCVLLLVVVVAGELDGAAVLKVEDAEACEPPRRTLSIAFGSCLNHRNRAPTLVAAAGSAPDVFVFLGDNLYNDLDRWGVPCEPAHCGRRVRALTSPLLRFIFGLLPSALQRYVLVGSKDAKTAASVALKAARLAAAPDGEALSANYAMLARRPDMVALRRAVPLILATWVRRAFDARPLASCACRRLTARAPYCDSSWRRTTTTMVGTTGLLATRTRQSAAISF
jgi:hypothetical protein